MSFIQKIAILLVTLISLALSELDRSDTYIIQGGKYDGYFLRADPDYSSQFWNISVAKGELKFDYYMQTTYNLFGIFESSFSQSDDLSYTYSRNNKEIKLLGMNSFFKPDKLPPVLKIKNLRFTLDESSTLNRVLELPDNTLLGGQSGFIEFDIVNEGKGDAKGVSVIMTGSSKQNSFITGIKKNRSISFPISAPLSTSDTIYYFTILVEDLNGFDAPSESISINVREVSTPKFELASVKVDDDKEGDSWGNNDGVINKGEAIEVTFTIKNTGNGNASNAAISIEQKSEPGFFLSDDQTLSHTISEFKARDSESFSFSFLTNKKMKGNKIPIKVKVSESSGEFGAVLDLNLKIDKASRGY